MKPSTYIEKESITIIGIEARTTNEAEMAGSTAKIPGLWGRFFQEGISEKIPNKVHPQVILALYSHYDGDEKGEYTITVGQEVSGVEDVPEGTVVKEVPASKYAVFTTERGPLPGNVIETWQGIWGMAPSDLEGERSYSGDLEIYDERAADPQDAEVDVCIAVR